MTSTRAPAPAPEPPAWPSGLRGVGIALTTADPGLGRLRSAVGSVVVLAVTAGVVAGGALLLGVPVSVAVPGVIVAAVTSMGLGDGASAAQLRTIGLVAVAVSVTATISSLVGDATSTVGIPVFVALGITVVFLQRLGPPGFVPGLAGFIAYLATSLSGLGPGGLPVAVGGAALAGLAVAAVRWLLRPRRPDRMAWRALDAVETRAALSLLSLAAVLREDGSDSARRRARRHLAALRRAATTADDRLGEADRPVAQGSDNQAVGVRVFDLRLGLEHLAGLLDLDRLSRDPEPTEESLRGLAELFDDVGRALLAPRDTPARWSRVDDLLDRPAPEGQARVRHTLARVVAEWRRPPDALDADATGSADDPDDVHGDDERDDRGDDEGDDDRGGAGGGAAPVTDTMRRALQVGLAVAAAALAGQAISSSQWFFAVVIAFVVFASSSSRGGVLSEGWHRTVGTLLGAVVGVGAATAVGGDPVITGVLLAVCLVGALYTAGLSSTALMVFITTAIALVYGVIGQFTVNVLLVRLAETAAGAGIGIAVSFLVLPTRTRTGFADAVTRFLRAVRVVVDESVQTVTCDAAADPAVQTVDEGGARELRDAYGTVVAAAAPLTDGPAGLRSRTSYRDALRVVESCDHHARLLLSLARRHGAALGPDADAADALRGAGTHVGRRLDALATRLDRQVDDSGAGVDDDADEHARVLGALDDAARRLDTGAGPRDEVSATEAIGDDPTARSASPGAVLEAVGARLRAVDRALTDLASRR